MLAFDGRRAARRRSRSGCATAPAAGMTLFRYLNVGSPGAGPRADRRPSSAAAPACDPSAPPAARSPPTRRAGSSSRSATGRRRSPATWRSGAVDDEDLAERVGAAIGREARAMGVNVVYAPVLRPRVRTRPTRRSGIRSFGDDPAAVARHRGGDGPRPAVGRGGRRGQALPGARRASDLDTHHELGGRAEARRADLEARRARRRSGRRSRRAPGS